MAKDEPQSYGSQADWVKGTTGQEVNRQKGHPHPDSAHGDFYESRRDSEDSAPHQGGEVSPVQLAENSGPGGLAGPTDEPQSGVTDQTAGARRGSWFRDRDYR